MISGIVFVSLIPAVAGLYIGLGTGPIGMAIAVPVAGACIWRLSCWRVSVDGDVVTYHRILRRHRFADVVKVHVAASTTNTSQLPGSVVFLELGDGQFFELSAFAGVPFFKAGHEQARRSAAWLAGRLGMVQVGEDTWKRPL